MTAVNEPPIEITCLAVKDKIDTGEPFLFIDCRNPDEHAQARIEGTRLVPMNEISTRIAEFEAYREQEIVIHCHHGGRSARVADWLREQGFAKARTMVGGIDRWAEEIDRSVPRY